MLVIRLQRTGRTNLATYRIVVAEKARAAKGKFHEIVGHYLPAQKTPTFKFDAERIEYWVSKGAMPSNTVARLLKREGMKGMEKFITNYTKRRSKKTPPEEPAAPPAPAAPAETPAEEAPAAPEQQEAAPAETAEAPVEAPAEEAAPAPEATEGDKAAA